MVNAAVGTGVEGAVVVAGGEGQVEVREVRQVGANRARGCRSLAILGPQAPHPFRRLHFDDIGPI